MSLHEEEKQRMEVYEKIHLRGTDENLTSAEKITALRNRTKSKFYQMLFNAFAILFFSYWWYAGLTSLPDYIYYIILAVFGVNVGLLFLQRKQIDELTKYLETKP